MPIVELLSVLCFEEFAVIVMLAVHAVLAVVAMLAVLAAPMVLGPELLVAAVFITAFYQIYFIYICIIYSCDGRAKISASINPVFNVTYSFRNYSSMRISVQETFIFIIKVGNPCAA